MANAKDYLTMHRTGMIMQDKFPDASSELGMAHGYGTGNDLTNQTAFSTFVFQITYTGQEFCPFGTTTHFGVMVM